MTFGVQRIAEGADHVLPGGGLRRHIGQQLLQAFALHGSAVAVQQASIQQQLHHLGNAAGVVQINGHVAAAGLEITDHRHALTDPFEVIDAQVDAGGTGNGQQVQYRIGGATHRHDHANGVFKGFLGEQVQRANVGFHCLHQHLSGASGTVGLFLVLGCHRGAVGKAQPHRFDGGTHGVGGEHAAATASPRAGIFLNCGELLFVDLAAGELPHRLKSAHHREITAPELARLDRAAVDEHRRNVHPSHGQHGARHVLVAATNGQHPIHALTVAGRFDGVSNHFTAHQGVLHPFSAHGDSITHGDGSEHLGHASGLPGCFLSPLGEVVQPHIAGGDGAVAVGDAQDGLAEIAVTKAHGAQHGAVGRPLDPLGDGVGAKHGTERTSGDQANLPSAQPSFPRPSSWARTRAISALSFSTRSSRCPLAELSITSEPSCIRGACSIDFCAP